MVLKCEGIGQSVRIAASDRILGIDPGLRITGYAVIEARQRRPNVCEAGFISSPGRDEKAALALRLVNLHHSLRGIIEQFRPTVVAIEELYAHYQHPRTAILMGHARGVILLAAAEASIPVVSYSATRIKKTITGNGRAPKDQMQRSMQRELCLAKMPEPPDVADALAIALCHFFLRNQPGSS